MASEMDNSSETNSLSHAEGSTTKVGVPTFAETWATAYPVPPQKGRLVLAMAACLGFVACVFIAGALADAVPMLDMGMAQSVSGAMVADDPMTIVVDMEKARQQRQQAMWAPQMPSHAADVGDSAAEATAAPALRQGRPRPDRAQAAAAIPVVSPVDATAARYAAIWGTEGDFSAMATRPSSPAPREAKKVAPTGAVGQGTVLFASLESTVASVPADARVIARLTKTQRLGATVLKMNSKVHGRVLAASNDDTRILVDFDFIVAPSGKRTDFSGSAQDTDGRAGVPARKLLSGASGGSAVLAGATRGGAAAGAALGGGIGSIAGSAFGGAVDKLAEKGQRLDRDEYVVVADKGTVLRIYVNGVEKGAT